MGKSKRVKRYDETDEERQERLLDQVARSGRQQVAPPGFFHDTGERQTRRKERKAEKARLRNYEQDIEEDFDELLFEDDDDLLDLE